MDENKPQIFLTPPPLPLGYQMIEIFEQAIKELFFIQNPHWNKKTPPRPSLLSSFQKRLRIGEVWISLPWQRLILHTVSEKFYFQLRTSRNRELITRSEQFNYRRLTAGVAGLSVGSVILSALVISGGPRRIKLADPDIIEITNLNRLQAKLTEIGQNKTLIAARRVWEIDPFAELFLEEKGLTKVNLRKFIEEPPRLQVFIDEMDDLNLKIAARLLCRKCRVPVLMATDIGDRVLLDVERFDQEPRRLIFHGRLNQLKIRDFSKLDHSEWVKFSTKIIGQEYLPPRLQRSLLQIGRVLSGVPQLGTTAMMAGAAMACAVRKIANRQPMPSGRYLLNLEGLSVDSEKLANG